MKNVLVKYSESCTNTGLEEVVEDTPAPDYEELSEDTPDPEPQPIETQEPVTEITVDETPVDNSSLFLDIEAKGSLEELNEHLKYNGYKNTTDDLSRLTLLNLDLSYGLESFGLSKQFTIASENDHELLTQCIDDVLQQNKSSNTVSLESRGAEAISTVVNLTIKILDVLISLTVKLTKIILNWVMYVLKIIGKTIKGIASVLKDLVLKLKDSNGKMTYVVPSSIIEGSVFNIRGDLRTSGLIESLNINNDNINVYSKIIGLLVNALDSKDFEIAGNDFENLCKESKDNTKKINFILDSDFGGYSKEYLNKFLYDETEKFELYSIDRGEFNQTVTKVIMNKDLQKYIDVIEKDLNKIEDQAKLVLNNADKVTVEAKRLSKGLTRKSAKGYSTPEAGKKGVAFCKSASHAVSKSVNRSLIFSMNSLKGIQHFITSLDRYLKDELGDLYKPSEPVPSTESFILKDAYLHEIITDPDLTLKVLEKNFSFI